MPTPPLSSDLVTRLGNATAWRFETSLGTTFTPRFFCCDDPNELGLTTGKEPVAVIELSPNPAFVSETVDYAGTLSYDPDGSVTSYAWTFESHTPASGTASSGTLNYGAAGTYTIELTVTDGTGLKSLPAREELVVKAPGNEYFTADGNGVHYTTDGGQNWTQVFSAAGANAVAIDPATQANAIGSKTVWITTAGTIYVTNEGTTNWTAKNPGTVTNVWSDSPAPTPSDLTYKRLLFAGGKLFVTANWQNSGTLERSWLFHTDGFGSMRTDTSGSITWTEATL